VTGPTCCPVLEVGGSHVTAALVDPVAAVVPGTVVRRRLDPHGDADEILATVASTADEVPAADGASWGVAVPGPFDYQAGIARYHGVGKFDALDGVDVGRELTARMSRTPAAIVFLNDAHAFGLGEWHSGAAVGQARAVAITLGTGIGSAFLADGRVVERGPTVPLEGRVDLLTIGGRPLEETVSSRAMLRRYVTPVGSGPVGLDRVAARALDGDPAAREAIAAPLRALGSALGPWLVRFDATVLVVGGSVSRAWTLVEPALRAGLEASRPGLDDTFAVVASADSETSALCGAALRATAPTP
jgi:glucokinase